MERVMEAINNKIVSIEVEVNENQEPVVNARELHEFLEVKSKYADWFNRMIEYGFDEGVDFVAINELSQKKEGSRLVERVVTNHALKLDMAKEIAMLQRNERGKQARRYFLQIEKDWNSPEKVMARALILANKKIDTLQLENQEMKPKAEYFDALVDRNLLTNVRDTAKELGVKERVFTRWLVQNKFCYRDKRNKLKPYAEKKKYFELKEFATQYGHADVQMLINPKGREAFRLLLIKDGLIASDYKQVCMIG